MVGCNWMRDPEFPVGALEWFDLSFLESCPLYLPGVGVLVPLLFFPSNCRVGGASSLG